MRQICRNVFAANPIETAEEWRKSVLAIWRGARFREERYAAVEPTGVRAYRSFQTLDDMWKRRSSIICQVSFKGDTDLKLLYDCIRPSLASKEFFLRKAIGWALRQYAWTDAAEVRRYVREHESQLAPLSRREALKNI